MGLLKIFGVEQKEQAKKYKDAQDAEDGARKIARDKDAEAQRLKDERLELQKKLEDAIRAYDELESSLNGGHCNPNYKPQK